MLLAVEGATIPQIGSLLSVHIFVGMLLFGPLTLKLASTGYRFLRYYAGSRGYVRLGPPAPFMRFAVAPALVLSTLVLFGTGVALLVSPRRGPMLELHKASFIVWFGATSIHVLAYTLRGARSLRGEIMARGSDGRLVRLGLAGLALILGLVIALSTYPLADPWLHGAIR